MKFIKKVCIQVGEKEGKVIQLGVVPLPKTSHPERMKENFDVFNFELTETDMTAISSLNKDERMNPVFDPDNFTF